MVKRIIGSIVALAVYWVIIGLYTPHTVLLTSKMAGQQLEDTDAGFVLTSYFYQFVSGVGVALFLVLLAILATIWYKPIRQLIATLVIIATVATAMQPNIAWAFAETSNKTEVRGIESDETAFVIPNFGKTTDQAQYRSETYLNRPDVKVPGKFFVIPHEKLSGTGGSSGLAGALSSDYYVSTVTLIKVKRSPYSREWVREGRGSNSKVDESFPCQTAGGHNIGKIGVSIGVSIADNTPETNGDAARYLTYFGLEPLKGNLDDLQTIFTSVRYARILTDVTDHVVRQKVQTTICREISKYQDPRTASAAMNTIMDDVEGGLRKYLKDLGITLNFIGWADTWTFDDDIQTAINQSFIAEVVADKLDILRQNAPINVMEGLSAGFRKGLPNFMVIPENMMSLLKSASGASDSPPVPTSAPTPK